MYVRRYACTYVCMYAHICVYIYNRYIYIYVCVCVLYVLVSGILTSSHQMDDVMAEFLLESNQQDKTAALETAYSLHDSCVQMSHETHINLFQEIILGKVCVFNTSVYTYVQYVYCCTHICTYVRTYMCVCSSSHSSLQHYITCSTVYVHT